MEIDPQWSMTGTIKYTDRLGHFFAKVEFILCDFFLIPAILGADFCNRLVEAIRPKDKLVELEDGSSVPIGVRILAAKKASFGMHSSCKGSCLRASITPTAWSTFSCRYGHLGHTELLRIYRRPGLFEIGT